MKLSKKYFSTLLYGVSLSLFAQVYEPSIKITPIELEKEREDLLDPTQHIENEQKAKELMAATISDSTEEYISYSPDYLIDNPDILENLLTTLLLSNNVEGLKLLLPLYAQVPTRDPYVIDWGEAIIDMSEGKTAQAVSKYRKIISYLPDHKLLRIQLAVALYSNGELVAARDQFQRLRSANLPPRDIEIIDKYLEAINKRDEWSFSGTLSYISNDNITNNAPKGTSFTVTDASGKKHVWTNNQSPVSANGLSYSFNADKNWAINDSLYSTLNIALSGKYYFNNKNYNDLTARAGVGVGYRNKRLNLELGPYAQKRWYGYGSSGDGSLKHYAYTLGLQLSGSYWFNPNWRYQGLAQVGKDDYASVYSHQDGNNYLLSNTITFLPNQKQYFYGGIDLNRKEASQASNEYDRYGIRLGWGQEWPKGVSTNISAGYAVREVKGLDFFNMKRRDKEFNTSISLWHRNIHLFGITPRLVYSFDKTSSNNAFYEYDNNRIFLDFRKTF